MDPALCHRNRAGKGRSAGVAARDAGSLLPMNVDHVASERVVVRVGRQFSVSLSVPHSSHCRNLFRLRAVLDVVAEKASAIMYVGPKRGKYNSEIRSPDIQKSQK